MRIVRVDVVMPSDALPEAEVKKVVAALEKQVQRDFAPVWNVSAEVTYVGKPERARADAWQLALLDSEGKDDDDGWHELTRDGHPMGRVFLREAKKCASGWSTTASHELLELLVNPDTTLGVFVWDKSEGGRMYLYEVCDACQDDAFAYRIDGVDVSDFVYPAWFETWRTPGSARFDHAQKLGRPFEVPKGCYATFYDARERKWVDNYGGHETPTLAPIYGYGRGGSRKRLRDRPRPEWRPSKL